MWICTRVLFVCWLAVTCGAHPVPQEGAEGGFSSGARAGRSLQAACGGPAKGLRFKCGKQPLPAGQLPPCGSPPPPITFKNAKFYAGGKVLNIHGVNWFGFNNAATMVDSLYLGWGKSQMSGDFASAVYQIKLLGFNTVRVPFRFTDLFNAKPLGIKHGCPPAYNQDIVRRATSPKFASNPRKRTPPKPLRSLPESAGTCNPFVPENTVLARYLYVIQTIVESGMYVVVDYHPTRYKDEPHIPASINLLVTYWTRLWKVIACSPRYSSLRGRLLLDLFNEPDAHNIGWNTGLGTRYLKLMDALDKITPGQNLYLVQGGGQHWYGMGWGDGFITDPKLVNKWRSKQQPEYGTLHDPNPFFRALMGRPYRTRVALAPHLYSVVVLNTYNFFGKKQYAIHSKSWGHMMKNGYCVKKKCQRFPVVAGEMGSKLTNGTEVGYYNSLSKYMRNVADAKDGLHVPFNNWIWWTWNPNSKDTGGLVSEDGSSLVWRKIDFLTAKFGLRPWYV